MLNSPIELSIFIIVALLIVAFIAGYIDTLVGGGGLITIPALMLVGVPPIYALGRRLLARAPQCLLSFCKISLGLAMLNG